MNRILPHIYSKLPFTLAPDAPSECGFCFSSLLETQFHAVSKLPPKTAICKACLQRFERMARLAVLNEQEPDWSALFGWMGKRLLSEPGTRAAKRAVGGLVRKLCQRSFSILNGERELGLKRCGLSGLPLTAPRIALVGTTTDCMFHLVSAAAEVIGMPVVQIGDDTGTAMNQLMESINFDFRYLDHAILFATEATFLRRQDACPIVVGTSVRPDFGVDLSIDVPSADPKQ